ncbi:MAG: ABC transporter substrate-binding protein [Deltaproteobacteria bacterium]|nr:ABC transporter substrate-binding protein [Deltaproteobacteria bacterium]
MTEMQAGIFRFSVKNVQDEIISRFRELGFLVPIDWQGLFGIDPRMDHPEGIGVAIGTPPAGIMYNKNKVPKDRIPKRWEDCYDPYFKGRLAVDVRPIDMLAISGGYGKEWTLDYARKLAANNPRWMRGQVAASLLVAAGELLIVCPAARVSWYRQARQKPDFPVGWVFPEGPIVARNSFLLSPMKGAPNFNAAVLLTGWIGSKGVAYLDIGTESLFHPETKLGTEVKRLNRKIKVLSWDEVAQTEQKMQEILKVWGFPRASK